MEALARLPSASSLLSLLIAHDDESTEGENGFWYHPVESRSSLKVAAHEGFVPDSIPVIEDYSDDDDSMVGMDIDMDNDDNDARRGRSSLLVPPASVLPCHVVLTNDSSSSILATLAAHTGSPLLDMLPDEIMTNTLAFLTIADVRAFAGSCWHAKKMVYDNHMAPATRHLWHSLSRQTWALLGLFSDEDSQRPQQRVVFRDDLLSFSNYASQPRLSHLTGLTAKSHPVQLSSSSFQGSDNENGRIRQQLQDDDNRTLLRRLMQQRPPSHQDFRHYAMPFAPRTAETTSSDTRSFSISATPQEVKLEKKEPLNDVAAAKGRPQKVVPVVQFVGSVGSGDRCVRSIEPLPRPQQQVVVTKRAPPPGTVVGTRKPILAPLREMMSEWEVDPLMDDGTMSGSMHRDGSNSTLSSGGRSTSRNALFPARTFMRMIRKTGIFRRMVPASSLLQKETVLRPFVSPYVSQTVDGVPGDGIPQVVEMNVTPRMVAYYELSILPQKDDENEERPRTVFAPQQAAPQAPEPVPAPQAPAPQRTNRREAPAPAPAQAGAANAPAPENGNNNNNEERAPARECIALGVSKSDFPLWGRMPGWDGESYGYHGDDGGIFHGRGDMVKRFGPSYGAGDTVGCGVDYVHKAIFFTLNGEFLGYAWTDLQDVDDTTEWFPTVGVDSNCPLSFNFGDRPFAFDLSEFCSRHARTSRVALRKCVGNNV